MYTNVSTVFCKNVGHRDARGIWGTYTSTVIETSTSTSLIPSSCVQVDATLPPCRNIRFLNFPVFSQNPTSDSILEPEQKADPRIETTPLGWGEYFGMYAPTVTITETHVVKTVVPDPRIVVTYAVKNCRPYQLPLNLDRCPSDTQSVAISQVLPTSTIVPTATVPVTTPKNTKVIDVTQGTSFTVLDINDININNLEGSNANLDTLEPDTQPLATEPLPF